MPLSFACPLAVLVLSAPLAPGDSARTVTVDGGPRSYLVHVPPNYDARKPTPVVLCYHGAVTNGRIQLRLTGLNTKADEAGFIVAYPNGTGPNDTTLFWNVGAFGARRTATDRDDVAFTHALLDDLAGVANVDAKRVFACGMSNGGMMCHRLAIEMSDRIAAIAPVGGTLAMRNPQPQRPVPVMQIHGTEDEFVPWTASAGPGVLGWSFLGVEETIDFWVKHNGCATTPLEESLPDRDPADDTTVERFTYGGGPAGADVVLVKVVGGGHTWPGRALPIGVLGRTTKDVDANDLIWEFFLGHPLK
jgi:polyhydroxybutyrate depolymerase